MLETIEYVDGLRESGGALIGADAANVCLRPVKNDSGADVPRFGILGIASVLFSPADDLDGFQAQPAFVGTKPQFPGHVGRFCIAIEPIAAGEIGLAVFSGICPVHVFQPGNMPLPFADIADQTVGNLQAATFGAAQILWQENGPGLHWAIVRLATPETIVRAVLLEDLPACGAALAQVLDIAPDKSHVPDRIVVVTDPLGVMDGNLLAVEKSHRLVMPAGTLAYVKFFVDSSSFEVLNYGGGCVSGSGSDKSGSGSGSEGSGSEVSGGEESGNEDSGGGESGESGSDESGNDESGASGNEGSGSEGSDEGGSEESGIEESGSEESGSEESGGEESGGSGCGDFRVPPCPADASADNPYFLACDGGCPYWIAAAKCESGSGSSGS